MTLKSLDRYRFLLNFAPEEGGGSAPPAGTSSPGSTPASSPSGTSPPSSPTSGGETRVSGEVANERPDPSTALPFTEDASSFDAFNSQDDLDEITLPAADTGPKPEGTTPKTTPTAEPGKTAEPAKTAPTPTSDQVKPAESSSAQPPKGASAPPTSEIEAILQGFEGAAQPLIEHLAKDTYALSEAEQNALDTDAIAAIPKIMARVHLEAVKNSLRLTHLLVPKLIQESIASHAKSSARGQAALGEFFRQWPGLNAGEHTDLVNEFASIFRQRNPKASRAEAIQWVGKTVHAHTGIPIQMPGAGGNGNGAGARVVSRTPVGGASPFAPARPGARTVSQVPDASSPWDGLGEDHEETL